MRTFPTGIQGRHLMDSRASGDGNSSQNPSAQFTGAIRVNVQPGTHEASPPSPTLIPAHASAQQTAKGQLQKPRWQRSVNGHRRSTPTDVHKRQDER
jgi:hypothetical protein